MSKQYMDGSVQSEFIKAGWKKNSFRRKGGWNIAQWLSEMGTQYKIYHVKRVNPLSKKLAIFEIVVKPKGYKINLLFWSSNQRGERRCTSCVRGERCSLGRFIEEVERDYWILDCFHFESKQSRENNTRDDETEFKSPLFSFYRLA